MTNLVTFTGGDVHSDRIIAVGTFGQPVSLYRSSVAPSKGRLAGSSFAGWFQNTQFDAIAAIVSGGASVTITGTGGPRWYTPIDYKSP